MKTETFNSENQPICPWAQTHPLLIDYHNHEWGVPQHNGSKLLEAIILDGFQAGLSWLTILKKRENFRKAFDGFNPEMIAGYGNDKVNALLQDAGIIRNRQKITSAIRNAKAFLEIRKNAGSFDQYLWAFTKQKTIKNKWKEEAEIPAKTELSDLISADLKKNGFSFVGSTICYAMMQAIGIVNDHLVTCYRYHEV